MGECNLSSSVEKSISTDSFCIVGGYLYATHFRYLPLSSFRVLKYFDLKLQNMVGQLH